MATLQAAAAQPTGRFLRHQPGNTRSPCPSRPGVYSRVAWPSQHQQASSAGCPLQAAGAALTLDSCHLDVPSNLFNRARHAKLSSCASPAWGFGFQNVHFSIFVRTSSRTARAVTWSGGCSQDAHALQISVQRQQQHLLPSRQFLAGAFPRSEPSRGAANAGSRATVNDTLGEVTEEEEEEAVDLSGVQEWELDFCSRPMLDERGKRVWELLVCDSSRRLQFAEFFPSNKINSATLKDALERIMTSLDAPKPQKIRFFRAQMQTIISKACAELDIQAVPSQRCVTLVRWLEERLEEVYKRDPSFQANAPPLLQLEPPPPQDLPDTLRGEQWAFVQLPLSGIFEEIERVSRGDMFGSVLNLEAIGLGDLPPTTMIPGVAVASSRATPLAAWTSSLELANLRADPPKACLLLATGVSDTWRYAFYRKSAVADAEARAWEEAKRVCSGLHFLAVQKDLEEEDCTGFWLMHDTNPPTF